MFMGLTLRTHQLIIFVGLSFPEFSWSRHNNLAFSTSNSVSMPILLACLNSEVYRSIGLRLGQNINICFKSVHWVTLMQLFKRAPQNLTPYSMGSLFSELFRNFGGIFVWAFETIQDYVWEVFWACFRRFGRYKLLLFRPVRNVQKAYQVLYDSSTS